MSSYRPLLKYWTVVFQEERQPKVRGLGTPRSALSEELCAIGWVVMREHFYWTVRCGDLGSSKVEEIGYLRIQEAHDLK